MYDVLDPYGDKQTKLNYEKRSKVRDLYIQVFLFSSTLIYAHYK